MMKRRISVLLIFMLLINLMMPASVFAGETWTDDPGYDQKGAVWSSDPWGDAFPSSELVIDYPGKDKKLDARKELYVEVYVGDTEVTVKKGESYTLPAAVASGSVAVDPEATTVTLTGINLKSEQFEGSEQPFIAVCGYQTDHEYTVRFVGDCNFGYNEKLETEDEMQSFFGIFGGGSTVKFQGVATEEGERVNLDARGILLTEGTTQEEKTKITKFSFEDLDIRTHTRTMEAMIVTATQVSFDHCSLEAEVDDNPSCCYASTGNKDHDSGDELVEFTDCSIFMVNHFGRMEVESSYGLIVSVYNSLHSNTVFKDCDTGLYLEHCTLGECRGFVTLDGGITIDGGSFIASVYGTQEEFTKKLESGAAIQAIYANIRNHAVVGLSAELSRTAWGLIYSKDVYVDDSELNVTAHGKQSNDEGIYYFGVRTSEGESIAPVGHAEFKNSKVSVDVQGVSEKYNISGISCRYFVADNSDISVKTVAEDDSTVANAIRAYNFDNNGGLILKNSRVLKPEGATVGLTMIKSVTHECYSILGKDGEQVAEFQIVPVSQPEDDPDDSDSSSAGTKTGVAAMKVSAANAETGIWDHLADGRWTFTGAQGLVKNRWVLAVNPYGGADAAGWFYMDENGFMLTGWQLISGKWYYLNRNADGWQGACLMDTITPDGYRVGADGAWIQK